MEAKKSSLSIRHIKKKIGRKTNISLSSALTSARKNNSWVKLAHVLSGSTRMQLSVNLEQIDKQAKAGDIILVPGKILGSGNITKKLRICALGISSSAREKLRATKSEFITIEQEMKDNPKGEGIKVIRIC